MRVKKNLIKITKIALIVSIIILSGILIKNNLRKKQPNPSFEITPEIARSREYESVKNGDEDTNVGYVKFDAFFLKDLDGDGNADSIRGTCNEIGKEDTLYMDLKVINNGYLKNGVITVNSNNFYLNTSIVKDTSIAQNYISSDTKTIKLNQMPNGTQKLLTGIVRSGDYSSSYKKTEAIGNDTTKYSKVNSITFTGTHVADNGAETEINKTINFDVDWYGMVTSRIEIKNVKKTINSKDELIEKEQLKLNFDITVSETKNQLILKSNHIEGIIPELNGYKPVSVQIKGDNTEFTYNEESREFTAKKESTLNENGIIDKAINTSQSGNTRTNNYSFEVIYPKEAYESIENDEIALLIPIKTWYEGYNNPSTQFTNPYVSNISQTTISAKWEKYKGYAYRFGISLGKLSNKPYSRYVISKEKPLKIYNNISEKEKEDRYTVRWTLTTGNAGMANTVIMKETKTGISQVSDSFIKTDSSLSSMENITSNVGIAFTGQDGILGENGWIKVINDETNELIEIFTKDNWNEYSESNPYKYKNPIKHIRVETSETSVNSTFTVYNIKELDDEYITRNYAKEEFDNLQYIKSTLTGYFDSQHSTVSETAHYEALLSIANIAIKKGMLSTQETATNQEITINTETSSYNLQKWKNGTFLVKFPNEILQIEVNEVTIDNVNVKIIGYDLYEENGSYFLKILTENSNETSYKITINCDITPDPRTETVVRNIELYATNEQLASYLEEYSSEDIYDIDGDLNTTEIINKDTTGLSLISPNELLTHQMATNYDQKNSITIAPRVAKTDKEQRIADVNISVSNNYTQDITDIVIQGVIPFEGNKYIIGNGDLGSDFSTWMSNTGITVPTALQNIATVYYSTEERPSKEIGDSNNKWQLKENVTDWSKIKTYIIDFGEYIMHHGEKYDFSYQINIPEGVEYNQISYSEHGIYFGLMTDQGKYQTSTAVSKLGFMIAKQYDLEITKYQEDTEKSLQGITFKITEEDQEEGKIKTTTANGKIKIQGLYSERTYTIKELKTINDYVLNEEEIKIYTYVDDEDKLHVTYKNNDASYMDLTEKYSWVKSVQVIKNEDEDNKVQISLENEVKPRLKIIKVGNQSNEKISSAAFTIKGENLERTILTDSNGELSLSGLYLNEQYEITERRKEGYYELQPVKFKIVNNNGIYSADIIEGNVKSQTTEEIDYIPQIKLTLENEKIPTYTLQITKVEEKNEENLLQNAEFILKGEDDDSQKKLTTNSSGVITIEDLYQYVAGKPITGKYTLQETRSPNGYVNNQEEINFVVEKNGDNLEISIENESSLTSLKSAEVDGNTIKLTLQDKPLFKLTKTDEETGEPLPNAKFIIYEIDDEGNEIDFAKDVNGNYVGTLNTKNQYIVETNEEGERTLPLRNGTYRSVEVEAPTGYEKNPAEEIFKITGSEGNEEVGTEDEYTDTLELNYIEDLLDFAQNVNNENTYSGTKVMLKRTLDFTDSNSYRDANDTLTYGDYNGDGNIESIKTELITGTGFKGIGAYTFNSNNSRAFSGIFDGQNSEIKGIYMNAPNDSYASLFRYVLNGKIKRLGVAGNITGYYYAAGLISFGNNVEIYNCYNNCKIKGNGYCSGIIANVISNVTIENCYNNGILEASDSLGGIVGGASNISNVNIKSSYNNANLSIGSYSGGIIGRVDTGGNVNVVDCVNYGNITESGSSWGGIVGLLENSGKSKIEGCINYGNIEYTEKGCSGGIVGRINNPQIYNCTNYGNFTNILENESGSYFGGIVGQIGSTNTSKIIEKCLNYGVINVGGGYYIGGICGDASGINITECGNYGDIINADSAGGIYGDMYDNSTAIVNTFNKGNIYVNNLNNAGAAGIAGGDCTVVNSYYSRKY